ncbi:Uri superfamily endonuclease [Halomicrobium zhouii]|uniref:Uri superfamily endonuclease n=1 Tax=Halomicrobium zhouii TaxID=767519 RepID=A0A1I6K5J5_9EURY|nr:GIY-YIG nuclease family protein [Halomicrobium zhouii]SFR86521.1 Uri superfamily endonuclease [Halomicrobium zhouii]
MAAGTYTLVVERTASDAVEVGALGAVSLPVGWYAYVGSAFGPGGFSRVDRHREVASGERDVRHWHVDYLLGDPATRLDAAVKTADVDAECAIAARIDGERVAAFGASDCGCESHLVYREKRDLLVESVERAHRDAREQRD